MRRPFVILVRCELGLGPTSSPSETESKKSLSHYGRAAGLPPVDLCTQTVNRQSSLATARRHRRDGRRQTTTGCAGPEYGRTSSPFELRVLPRKYEPLGLLLLSALLTPPGSDKLNGIADDQAK
jgi:hypothetical protein